MTTNLNLQRRLSQNVGEILLQGADLLGAIDDGLYIVSKTSAFADGGAIGGHFRHCLEFVNCFLAGLENGRVDYDRRERNHRIETMREYAHEEYLRTIQILKNFAPDEGNYLLVKPEDMHRDDEDFWCASSIERELEFLQSHTIHHYALIGFKLRAAGFALSANFGVAPSTLRYWKQAQSATR